MVANGVAARRGILFKTAASLEEAGRTQIVVLDKTGTITTGKMKVDRLIPFGEVTEEELLRAAATLEQASAHPLAKAVLEYAKEQNILPEAAEQFETHAGSGVSALWKAQILLGGKETFLKGKIPPEASRQAQELSSQGKTPLFFSHGERYLGLITVSDTVKPDSAAAVAELKRMGIRVIMLTGDREEVGRSVAQTVGIEEYHAGVLPMEKEDRIASLKKEGKVCMVGDGINDAPALVQADLGVAVGGGLDAAMDAAEVVLMRSTLSDLPLLIRLSQKTLKNIKENLFWAFCYNLLGIPLAAGVFHAWLGWDLNPMFGAAAMSLSSFCVVTNALRLYWFSDGKEKNKNSKKEKKEMEKVMKIQGMMCPHCEAHVKKALESLDGVDQVEASHQKGEARLILSNNVSDSLLKETVEKEGYRVL
jgi:Cu2+-exporting ATPase